MGAELFGLLLGVTDFKARHAQLGFGRMKVIGGEVSDPHQSRVNGKGLAVLTKHFHHFLGEPAPDPLADIDLGDRVEVFLHLDMLVGIGFGLAPLA